MRKRVFLSFDFDQDRHTKDLLVAQCRNPNGPFELTDVSLKESSKQKTWPRKAKRNIRNAGVVLVVLGNKTHKARGVRKEVEFARALNKPIIQVRPRRRRGAKPLPDAGPVCRWTWKDLRKAVREAGKVSRRRAI